MFAPASPPQATLWPSPRRTPNSSRLLAPFAPPPGQQKQRQFQSDGLLYLRSFFAPAEFESIRSECASLRGALRRERSTTAENRLGSYLAATGATRRAFASPLAAARVRSATGDGALSLSSFPLEFRVYPVSAAMAWHRDEQLFSEPQVEAVLTLSNTSDSETEWLDAAGVLHSVWTEPNSLLLVRAAGGLHRVRAVARGERSIVKAAFCDAAATRLPSYDANLTTYIA